MKINSVKLYSNNNHYRKIEQPNTQSNSVKTETKDYVIPKMAPNYMSNINFKGKLDWDAIDEYTEEMGKRIYSKRNVNKLTAVHEKADGITKGRGLPTVWTDRIKDIDNFDKDSFIQDFGKIFAKEREYADVDRLNKDVSDLFKKHKIIDEDTPFSVRYIGHGFQAWAYKIQIGNDENSGIVTKLFKRHNNYLQNHGNHTEQNLAEYIKNYANDDTEFTKYYYGDSKNGIMVVDYISPTQRPDIILDLTDVGTGYDDDFPKNRINGIICDFGGLITVSNLVGNKSAQDVHKAIKYAKTDAEKIEIFNNIFAEKADTDEFKDKAIGLVHSIKHMPEEMQPELYKKCYELGSHRVNIALIQNIKNFKYSPVLTQLAADLVNNAEDQKELENIAKEIRHVPDGPRHRFFERQEDTQISAVIKYLARNINHYYKDMPRRREIYDKFVENSDRYAGISLINSMKYMSSSRYDEYFEKFFAKNDSVINTTLARSLELLGNQPKVQKKWIDKLMECDDVDVKTGLCESVSYVNDEFRVEMLEKLLDEKDRVAKEFLAKNITSVPGYAIHPEWLEKLLDGADNMIRGALVFTIKDIKYPQVRKEWAKIVYNGADSTIRTMLKQNIDM